MPDYKKITFVSSVTLIIFFNTYSSRRLGSPNFWIDSLYY